jgi:hypothetical protein
LLYNNLDKPVQQEAVMKRLFVFLAVLTAVSACVAGQASSPKAVAELSFSFARQTGPASNQFAAWVEDAQGKYVKTLYATKYTAAGGWKIRETSIPVWVKKSGLASMTKAETDALTGSTPRTGTVTYVWDGTDIKDAALPDGGYVICLEGTLRWENQVMYRAPIRIGQGPSEAQVNPEYTGTPPAGERAMIGNVTVRSLR